MPIPAINQRPSRVTPAGEGQSLWRTTLEAGARLLQDTTPLKDFDIYVAGLHCAKHEPGMQMEAHHYCRQVNQDLLQCVLFDGNGRDANLIGIEYIISERLFGTLPESEKPYWHPHNYEILSGQLAALGAARGGRARLPQAVDEQLRQDLAHLAHRPPRTRARATGSRSATPSSCGRSIATARPANTSNATSSSTWRSMRPASAPSAKRSPNSPTPSTASTRWPASSPAPRPWRPWWTPRPAVRPR
jgi:Protein of unknown function (DUF1264)